MRVQAVKQMVMLQAWVTRINDCKRSGQKVTKWCQENKINTKTYYSWLKKVRESMLEGMIPGTTLQQTQWTPDHISSNVPMQVEKPVFAALPIPQTRGIAVTVKLGQHTMEIYNGADTRVVEQALRAVSQL